MTPSNRSHQRAGLTLRCARCHDHKFEPIPQADYYQLMALLTPAFNPADWKNPQQRALPDISAKNLAALNAHNGEIDKNVASCNRRSFAARRMRRSCASRTGGAARAIREDTPRCAGYAADKRTRSRNICGKTHGHPCSSAGGS